jgi:sigma-B regulation protein RsbU (phosphoserine phosphatase)
MTNSKWSVLVVDDCPSIRDYLKLMLEKNGYEVRLSSDAAEACWQIASNSPDFIVSDWQMPSMDGAALCKWVRNREPQEYVYFILMTAHERFFDAVDGFDSGADDYVQKPVKLAEMLARLRCGQRILKLERRLRNPECAATTDEREDTLQPQNAAKANLN